MRIIIFTAYFYPHKGGVESYVRDLFSGIDAEKIIITANTESAKPYEEWDGFKIYRLECWHVLGKSYPIIKPSEMDRIKSLMMLQPDFVITNTRFFHTSYLGVRFAKKYRIPLIHIEHGTEHSPMKNPLFRLGGVLYDHTFGSYIIKHAWKVAGISKASERFIKHLHNRETVLIRNSISAEKFFSQKRVFGKKRKTLIYVGRLIYAKGVQDLLEVTKEMDVNVWIVGEGDYKDKLKKSFPEAKFLGQKSPEEIRRLLSEADIFVNPSYAEGLPTSILEAGAVGLPIIATDVGGTREIIDGGENGFLVKPRDRDALREKITILLNDKSLCKRFSKNIIYKIRKNFDWNNSRQALLDILKKPPSTEKLINRHK